MSVYVSDLIMDYNDYYSHGKSNVVGCATVYILACSSFGG